MKQWKLNSVSGLFFAEYNKTITMIVLLPSNLANVLLSKNNLYRTDPSYTFTIDAGNNIPSRTIVGEGIYTVTALKNLADDVVHHTQCKKQIQHILLPLTPSPLIQKDLMHPTPLKDLLAPLRDSKLSCYQTAYAILFSEPLGQISKFSQTASKAYQHSAIPNNSMTRSIPTSLPTFPSVFPPPK